MKFLIDIGHPGHVHFFKNFILEMQKKGHEFLVVARDKECTLDLLDKSKIKYVKRPFGSSNLFGKAINLIKTDMFLYKIAKKFKPDVLLGINNPYAAQTSCFIGKKSIIFNDTEHAKLNNFITYPFANYVCTPSCYKKRIQKKQISYDGYHEFAYLHPKRFKPNSKVLKEIGLKKKDKFFVLRFVSWEASHDIGHKGFSYNAKRKLVRFLEQHGRVIITSEKKLPEEFEKYRFNINPEKVHDVLAFAAMYIGEGGTMASEAAVLGVPSIYVNTLHMGYTDELNKRYGLVFQSTNIDKIIAKAGEILQNKDNGYEKRHKQLLKDKIDVTKWMINFVEGLK